jgi:predicted nucleic acid binding AN1-type Zn finger protein
LEKASPREKQQGFTPTRLAWSGKKQLIEICLFCKQRFCSHHRDHESKISVATTAA